MKAFDDEEEEKPQKLRGTVPKYPATGPLDAGSADDWMTWAGDFRIYAGINKLTKLLEPPHYGQVQLPPHIENGPQDPGPMPDEPIPLSNEERKDKELVQAYNLECAEGASAEATHPYDWYEGQQEMDEEEIDRAR